MDCPSCDTSFNSGQIEQVITKDKVFSDKEKDFIEVKGAIGIYQQCKNCKDAWPIMEYDPRNKKAKTNEAAV